jgi:hypothetical protein
MLLGADADFRKEDVNMYLLWLKQVAKLFAIGAIVFLLLIPVANLISTEPRILFFIVLFLFLLWRKQKEILPRLRRYRVMVGIVFSALIGLGLLMWWLGGQFIGLIAIVLIGGVFIIGTLVLVD